jgi:hypothetical protein
VLWVSIPLVYDAELTLRARATGHRAVTERLWVAQQSVYGVYSGL